MTPEILQAVLSKIEELNISQVELAKLAGIRQPTVSQLLTGKRGEVNESWKKLLDALELELTVVPKETK